MLQAAPKRSQAFPNSLYACVYLHTRPYHTRPYGIMLTIPPYTPQRPYIWDRPDKLYQVLHVLQFQTSSFTRYVCVSLERKSYGAKGAGFAIGRKLQKINGTCILKSLSSFRNDVCVLRLSEIVRDDRFSLQKHVVGHFVPDIKVVSHHFQTTT